MLILDTLNKTTIWGGTRLQKFGSDPLEPHVGSPLHRRRKRGAFLHGAQRGIHRADALRRLPRQP